MAMLFPGFCCEKNYYITFLCAYLFPRLGIIGKGYELLKRFITNILLNLYRFIFSPAVYESV